MMKWSTRFSAYVLAAGMVFAGTGSLQAAAEEIDGAEIAAAAETGADIQTQASDVQSADGVQQQAAADAGDMTGELIFAKCEEYINVRSDSSKKSDIVAKIYNYDSAVVLEKDKSWYKIQSGNVTGYVKAKFFATGAEADAIADEVAYNVAVVYPEELNVRTQPSEEAEVVTVAHSGEEIEVVAFDGNWMKVALGDDVYGYIHSDYAEYKTYYPTAETPEEEQARLDAEAAAHAETEEQYIETEPSYTEPQYTQTEAPVQTEPQYTQTEAPVQTEAPQTEAPQTEAPQTEAPQTEAPETEPVYEETLPDEEAYEDNGLIYDSELGENVYVDGTTDSTDYEETAPQTEAPVQTEAPQTDASASTTGQQIVDYAMQFIGNPYVWGGTSLTDGADCSGFTLSVFANFGIGLARTAADQSYGGTAVDISSIMPGDLLFYDSGSGIDHVAIYAGGGMIVHASNPTSGITTANYDYSTPVAARRYY